MPPNFYILIPWWWILRTEASSLLEDPGIWTYGLWTFEQEGLHRIYSESSCRGAHACQLSMSGVLGGPKFLHRGLWVLLSSLEAATSQCYASPFVLGGFASIKLHSERHMLSVSDLEGFPRAKEEARRFLCGCCTQPETDPRTSHEHKLVSTILHDFREVQNRESA